MTLVAGSYERFIFGFDVPKSSEPSPAATLQKSFVYPAHQSIVKCMATAGDYLVTGGADDQMHIYDITHKKDLSFLMNPGQGAITALQFYTPPGAGHPSHLVSAGQDGIISIWKAGGDWEHMKSMRGHKGAVLGLAVHPSGSLALSVAADKQLKLWDMNKGRCQYTARLDCESDVVLFAPLGDEYLLTTGGGGVGVGVGGGGAGVGVTCHSIEGQVKATLAHPMTSKRVHCVARTQSIVVTGAEDGGLRIWDLRIASSPPSSSSSSKGCVATVEKAHATRIRGVALPNLVDPFATQLESIASASSDGVIRWWDARQLSTNASSTSGGGAAAASSCVAEAETRARITSLVICDKMAVQQKRSSALERALKLEKKDEVKEEQKALPVSKEAAGKKKAPTKPKQPVVVPQRRVAPVRTTRAQKKDKEKEEEKEEEDEDVSQEEEEGHDGQEEAGQAKNEREAVWGDASGRHFSDLKDKQEKKRRSEATQRRLEQHKRKNKRA